MQDSYNLTKLQHTNYSKSYISKKEKSWNTSDHLATGCLTLDKNTQQCAWTYEDLYDSLNTTLAT